MKDLSHQNMKEADFNGTKDADFRFQHTKCNCVPVYSVSIGELWQVRLGFIMESMLILLEGMELGTVVSRFSVLRVPNTERLGGEVSVLADGYKVMIILRCELQWLREYDQVPPSLYLCAYNALTVLSEQPLYLAAT